MRILVKRFDHFLSHRYKIFEFSQDLECLLRLRWEHARREVRFDDHLIQPGTPLLELHLWNEHLPTISGDGADLSYALHIRRLILKSFRLLAQELAGNPRYSGVQAVYGLTALVGAGASAVREKLAQRLRFSLLP